MAQDWLKNQFDGQRNFREHHVLRLAVDMESGNFVPHNAITFANFDKKKYLIDGQHRLKAVEVYGKPIEMPVLEICVDSLDSIREMYGNIDQGLKRTVADAIRAAGLPDELNLPGTYLNRSAAALKLISTSFIDPTGGTSKGERSKYRSATRSNAINADLVRHWEDEIRVYHNITSGADPYIRRMFLNAPVLACAFLTLRYNPEKAKIFWSEAAKDDGLGMHDPRKKFVSWLRDRAKGEKPGFFVRGFSNFWHKFLSESEVRKYTKPDMRSPIKIEGIDFLDLEEEIKRVIFKT